MKDQKNKPTLNHKTILLTWFGTGLSPIAPGTIGSLATIPLLWLLSFFNIGTISTIISIIILTILSSILTNHVEKLYNVHDPSWIVFDEVLGMITVWLFYPSNHIIDLTLIFTTFRFFDILKPWPICTIDKRMINGWGTILDDIVAGIFAGITYLLIKKFLLP